MSLSRASNPLRKRPRLRQFQPLQPLFSTTPTTTTRPTKLLHTSKNEDTSTIPKRNTNAHRNRLFHSTPCHHVARSPSIRRTEASRARAAAASASDTPLFYNQPVQGSLEDRKQSFNKIKKALYGEAINVGVVNHLRLNLNKFSHMGLALIEEAYTRAPSGTAIRAIDSDVDLVYKIGRIISVNDRQLLEWNLFSGSLAGAYLPTILCAGRVVAKMKTAPPRTPLLDKIEALALHDRDSICMTLHAHVLGFRGQYTEALVLIDEVMGAIYPTHLGPLTLNFNDTFPETLPQPWEVYEWLKRRMGDDEAADAAVRRAAVEFQDPKALVVHAGRLMERGDLEMYEECLCKAATAAHPDACRKLANFYFLIIIGRYPRRGEKDTVQQQQQQQQEHQEQTASSTVLSWLSCFYNRSLPLDDYYKLAREWYELACAHGNSDAALTFALLLREEGNVELGRHYLDMAAMKPGLASSLRGYRVNWENLDVPMKVDFEKLDV